MQTRKFLPFVATDLRHTSYLNGGPRRRGRWMLFKGRIKGGAAGFMSVVLLSKSDP